jgi:hypothetical protein
MPKVFISQPMRYQNDDEIHRTRNVSLRIAECACHEELELLDSYFPEEHIKGENVQAKVISLLLEADVVCFAEGWDEADGCKFEYMIAEKCKKPIIKIGYRHKEVTLCNIKEITE